MNRCIQYVFYVFIVVVITSSGALADLVSQGVGDHYVAWEAEIASISDPDGDTRTWEVVSDVDASGNLAIFAPKSGDQSIDDGHATYSIIFGEAGKYELFVRMRGSGPGSDSFFIPPSGAFGLPLNGNRIGPLEPADPYAWVDTKGAGDYVVDASDLGIPLEIVFGSREKKTYVDRFVLWNRRDGKSPFPSDLEELDLLSNSAVVPVPGAALLGFIGMGTAATVLRRRRKKAAA